MSQTKHMKKSIIKHSHKSSEESTLSSNSSSLSDNDVSNTIEDSEDEKKVVKRSFKKKTSSINSKKTKTKSSQSSSKDSSSSNENSSENSEVKKLPILYGVDSQGKNRMWECWVEGNVFHNIHGIVGTKNPNKSQHAYEGKNLKNKNITSPEEQAWIEANKRWVKKLDKGYLPDKKDKEGQLLLKNVLSEKKKTGGHNINSVASSGARAQKKVKRQKENTCIVDDVEDDIIIPMKAQNWELDDEKDSYSVKLKVKKYFTRCEGKGKKLEMFDEEFYGQPKLDGWRCRVNYVDGEIVMYSNSGKQYAWFASLRKLLLKWFSSIKNIKKLLLDGLDCELYCDQFYEDGENGSDRTPLDPLSKFSTISSICGVGRSEPHVLENQIQLHCFDLIDKSSEYTQEERFDKLEQLFSNLPKECKTRIIKVETKILESVEDVPKLHDEYVKLGYEGIILRTKGLLYKPKSRSTEMRKFKMFKDGEYKIIGATRDKGVGKEHFSFSWIATTKEGNEFTVVQMGTREQKMEWYKNRDKYIGKFLTIKFQEFTEDGIPRFPVAKDFRKGVGKDS